MSGEPACPACGGSPVVGWGRATVKDRVVEGDRLRVVDLEVRRRRCTACGRTHAEPDPARDARARDVVRFVLDAYALDGAEGAAERCGMDARTVAAHVEREVARVLVDPIPDSVFIGSIPETGGAIVLGEGGPGRVLDAAGGGADRLGEILDRRGGDVSFAWIPLEEGVKEAARTVMRDATLALCTLETARLLDAILDRVPVRSDCHAETLRIVTRGGWTTKAYDGLRALARRENMRRDCVVLGMWDDEIRTSLSAPARSPGVGVPPGLRGFPPLRMRGLAAVTPDPTLVAMSRRLVLRQRMRSQP